MVRVQVAFDQSTNQSSKLREGQCRGLDFLPDSSKVPEVLRICAGRADPVSGFEWARGASRRHRLAAAHVNHQYCRAPARARIQQTVLKRARLRLGRPLLAIEPELVDQREIKPAYSL